MSPSLLFSLLHQFKSKQERKGVHQFWLSVKQYQVPSTHAKMKQVKIGWHCLISSSMMVPGPDPVPGLGTGPEWIGTCNYLIKLTHAIRLCNTTQIQLKTMLTTVRARIHTYKVTITRQPVCF